MVAEVDLEEGFLVVAEAATALAEVASDDSTSSELPQRHMYLKCVPVYNS